MTTTENNVSKCIETIVNDLGYKLYDVIYEKEGKDNYLRIFIDSENGISIEDCEKVNDGINDILDEKNFIKDAYFLEVSSPGVERRIRSDEHLKENLNKKIEVHVYKAINKEKELIGILKKYDDNSLTILITDIDVQIERKNISMMKTVFDWND